MESHTVIYKKCRLGMKGRFNRFCHFYKPISNNLASSDISRAASVKESRRSSVRLSILWLYYLLSQDLIMRL